MSRMDENDGPLSEEELDELDGFLMSTITPEDCMDIAMLDGFLTALAIGPNAIPPSVWLPVVWDGEVAWENQHQVRRMTELVFRHANSIAVYLGEDIDVFEPLLYENADEGQTVAVIDEWCSGFVRGMALDGPAWQPLLESEDGEEMLYPIMLYGTEGGWTELDSNPELAARHAEFAAMLGDSVLAIRDWWLPQRKAATTVRRDEPKTGRNDDCPCGSGRKFKKCCGAPERLH